MKVLKTKGKWSLPYLRWRADSPPLSFGAYVDAYLREAVRCYTQAKQWLDKAAAQGEWHAQELLAQLAAEETQPQEPIFFCFPSRGSQAAAWIAAAEAGNRGAQAEQKARADTPPIESPSMLNRDHYNEHRARTGRGKLASRKCKHLGNRLDYLGNPVRTI